MKIAFQDTQIEIGELDKQLSATVRLGIDFLSFGLIPFTIVVTNCEDWNEPTIMIGSTKLAKLYIANHLPKYGVVFYNRQMFDQEYYRRFINSDLLNSDACFYNFGDIKDQYVTTRMFIKPSSDLKYFGGVVLDPCDNTIQCELEKIKMVDSDLTDETIILVNTNTNKEIVFEYRAFVVDNKIIDCCQYIKNGKVTPEIISNDVRSRIYDFIHKIQEVYAPHDHYVIDIAELNDGKYKVIEYNCINCSGMYVNDREKIYQSLLAIA